MDDEKIKLQKKNKEIQPYMTTRINLEGIIPMLSEVGQTNAESNNKPKTNTERLDCMLTRD